MIDLTVKTLDSQNHSFSVGDETTVKQLKESIAESINIPPESQRLIYCGRVLQDEKSLSEYDVNGKVIHLVQRAPPQPSRSNGSQPGTRSSSDQQTPRRGNHRQSRMDGNTMYLGAMAFPADLIDTQGIQASQPPQSLTQSRLAIARRMLRRAFRTVHQLEFLDPDTSVSPGSSTPPNEIENGSPPGETAEEPTTQQPFAGSIAQAAHAATAAAIAAAVSAAQAAGMPNITIVRGSPSSQGPASSSLNIHIDSSGGMERVDASAAASSSEQDATSAAEAQGEENMQEGTPPPEVESQPAQQAASEAEPAEPAQRGRPRREPARTSAMAEILQEVERLNEAFEPAFHRLLHMMVTDPTYEHGSQEEQQAQRVFSATSEVFHYMAHAYHAMSDIICDMTTPPPRTLRCRPVLFQHSAVLQAGIPIQAQINVMTNRPSSANNGSQTTPVTTADNNAFTTIPATTEASTRNEESVPDAASQPQTQPPPQQQPPSQQQPPPQQPSQARPRTRREGISLPPPTFHLAPGNVEFFMEVGPGFTIDSFDGNMTMAPGTNGNSGAGGNESNAMGAAPNASEFIQNLMQGIMAGHLGRVGTPGSTASTQSSADGAGQNSQARGNTATHPTTATQTRSTSRPHVHLAPSGMQSLGSNNFDPFLPCNSHHLRCGSRRRPAGEVGQASTQTSSPLGNEQSQQQAQQPQVSSEPPPTETPPTEGTAATPLFNLFQNLVDRNVRVATATFPAPPRSASSPAPEGAQSQPPPAMQTQSQTAPQIAPFMSLLNMIGGQGPSASVFDGFGGFMTGGGSTLADLFHSLPDQPYVEGQSLLTDLIMALARNMTFQDLVSLSLGQSAVLGRLRPVLREFMQTRLLNGAAPSDEAVRQGVEQLLTELRPHLDTLLEAPVREDVDLLTTFHQYQRVRLPVVINLILSEDNDTTFSQELVSWCRRYVRELSAVLLHCFVFREQEMESVVRCYVLQVMAGICPAVRHWTVNSTLTHLRGYLNGLNVPQEDIQQYLVYRIAEVPVGIQQQQASAIVPPAEPMETDSSPPEASGDPQLVVAEAKSAEVTAEPLPDVILGSEPWHGAVPPEWVPVIARDSQRQRRQGAQPPFSDAYLSGMPSKRRKVVTSAKPQGSLSQVIAGTVRTAVDAAAVGSVVTRDTVVQAAGSDPVIQAAYREQVRQSVREGLTSNPDFTPEKFPNAAKYFDK